MCKVDLNGWRSSNTEPQVNVMPLKKVSVRWKDVWKKREEYFQRDDTEFSEWKVKAIKLTQKKIYLQPQSKCIDSVLADVLHEGEPCYKLPHFLLYRANKGHR